jgi:hypothetical protein
MESVKLDTEVWNVTLPIVQDKDVSNNWILKNVFSE